MQAAALKCIGHFARVVRGQYYQRDLLGLERANLRYRDLEIGKQFEQERLKLGISLVYLVDEQHDSLLGSDGLEQRARQHETFREEHLVLGRDLVDGLRQSLSANQHFADLV